ncbi:MAG: hypothetical protein ABSF64_35545 [Bryobacteraceae bacterium]|jgi:hypothetical protein
MKPLLCLLLSLPALAPITALAAGNAALGQWVCVATSSDPSGHDVKFDLNVKEIEGKLSIVFVLQDTGEELPVTDPKVDGGSVTFKVNVDEVLYKVELQIDGGKAAGKYSGENDSGTIVGSKKP